MNAANYSSTLLREPRSEYHAEGTRNKQIARIIVHLRDQLRHDCSQLTMPSQWMIRNLVDNAIFIQSMETSSKAINNRTENWHAEVFAVLNIIRSECDVGLEKFCAFTQKNGSTPLFPNHELFDEWDTYRFSLALLHYLEKET